MKKQKPKKRTWSVDGTLNDIQRVITAETFLIAAVQYVGFDWCIEHLQKVKAANCEVETTLSIILLAATGRGADLPKPDGR